MKKLTPAEKKKLAEPGKRIIRREPPGEAEMARIKQLRAKALASPRVLKPEPGSLGAQLAAARQARNLTWYAVAKLAGVQNPATIRDIERGRDVKLSTVEAVAKALDLKLELVGAG